MKNVIADLSTRKAAMIVGIGLILMFVLAIFAEGIVFADIIVPDDAGATKDNIKDDEILFGLGITSYIIILVLDVLIAFALYVILKPINNKVSALAAGFRLVYTAIMGASLFALALLFSNEYVYGQLLAYVFFIAHVFALGYLVFKSHFIPRWLGVFLIIASFCYIILTYGEYVLSDEWMDVLGLIALVPATFAELSLGIWLLLKRNNMSDMKNQDKIPA
jgi:hypothetical protein